MKPSGPMVEDGLPLADYLAIAALSSSGARVLVDDCPAAYWATSPCNPKRLPDEDAGYFDIGAATHLLALEPDAYRRRVAVVQAKSWRDQGARVARTQARQAGLVPLLKKEEALVRAMRRALRDHPIAGRAFEGAGVAERTIVWRDPELPVWRKARPDWLPASGGYTVDLKTAASAHPAAVARAAARDGWHVAAAWYHDAVEASSGVRPRRHAAIVVAKDPPHLVAVYWLSDEALAWGRLIGRRAVELFHRCETAGRWPSYGDPGAPAETAMTLDLPGWTQRDLESRRDAGEFASPELAVAYRAQQPL